MLFNKYIVFFLFHFINKKKLSVEFPYIYVYEKEKKCFLN